ncbi:hypothetical protein Clacol_004912 [Clathrus columnatus]|uniref:NACHT domain-containing protein n=1 Tax=Clathrus columnatus TaxID=1419009 RepID=A0AAV5ACP2_9AGAM|nr:hypothetical protein Clacol_004912 [Clathrus columnatus]
MLAADWTQVESSTVETEHEILESSAQAASRALESTRNIAGQHLEHEDKPGCFERVGQSVVKRLSLFTNLVQKFADGVTDTQTVDQEILDLFETLDFTYKFIEDATDIKNSSHELILSSLAKQTVECAYFIRDYAKKHNFWIRVGTNIIGEPIKLRVQSYRDAFSKLLNEFQIRSALHTEIAVGRLLELNQSMTGAGLHTGKQCLPGTRIEVLDEITDWINNADEGCPRLFWLAGPAGAGKSAIAHSIALRFKSIHRLGSFFCFDRNYPSERRREKIFPTIARDLADLDLQIKRELAKAIKNEASSRTTVDLHLQWEKFIFEPLRVASEVGTGPILIVIDALDESGDPISHRELLKTLETKISFLPVNIRFLVTSRPEKDILLSFNKMQSKVRTKMMNTIPEAQTKRDILTSKQTWPMKGLFQWAYFASEFLIGLGNGAGSTATERYEDLINTQRVRSINDPLDDMYKQILSFLFDSSNPLVMARFRSVIGNIVVAAEPLSLGSLVGLREDNVPLSRRETDVKVVIQYLGSLLSGIGDPSLTIRPLHLSFREYLLDHNCSHEFSIDQFQCHQDIAFGCLRTMMEGLKFNICNISSSYTRNVDDDDLPKRISSSISSTLSYSTRFWALHVSSTVFNPLLAGEVEKFLNDGFLLWLEVLSLLQAVNGAARSMSSLISWCSEKETYKDLYNFVVDGKRFIQLFGSVILESAPHVYLSALPFCPQQSIIYQTFINRFSKTLRIASGPLQGWPLAQRRIDGMTDIECVCFSHRGQYLAVGLSGDIIKVLNFQTLALLWTTEPGSHTNNTWIIDMQFSSNDKSLVVAAKNNIRSFDILTGCITTLDIDYVPIPRPLLSHDAKFMAWVYNSDLIKVVNLETKEEVIKISLAPQQALCHGFSNTDNPSFVVYLGRTAGVRIWVLEKRSVLQEFAIGLYHILKQPMLSPNGRQIIFLDRDRGRGPPEPSYIWDFRDNSFITLKGYGLIQKCTITPKGDCVVIHTHGKLILRHINGNELHCEKTNGVISAVSSKDGKWLAIFRTKGLDILELDGWQTCSAHLYHFTSDPWHLPPIAVSPDGKFFLFSLQEKDITIFAMLTRESPFGSYTLNRQDPYLSIRPQHHEVFSPKSRYFGYVSDEGAFIYDIERNAANI